MLKDTLTKEELRNLADEMEKMERETYLPYKNISGGFADAVMYDYDDEKIDIELTFGVQSDCSNTVHSENITIDRKDLKQARFKV